MTKIGIDNIKFYTPNYVLDLKKLAQKRGYDINKYSSSFGQENVYRTY